MRARFAFVAAVLFALAAPVQASAREDVVTSFDGTQIAVSFFPAPDLKPGQKRATILIGPGWAQGRDTADSGGSSLFGYLGPKEFLDAGYNVLTWDPRGFGDSGGTVEVDSPPFERRDVQKLIDYVARQPEARHDRRCRVSRRHGRRTRTCRTLPNDPRLGMEGASYGGGIQLVTAAFDRRIDALIPVIAWNSLVTALDKDGAVKGGWASVLVGAGIGASGGDLDPHITSSYQEGVSTGHVSEENRRWFESRGPGDKLVGRIKAPTLLVQGTADTLFTLQEAIRNYGILHRNHVPVKMLWFCGGHGTCLTGTGPADYIRKAMLNWFDRYLRGRDVATGPGFQWIDQDGTWRSAPRWPAPPAGSLVASGSGVLPFNTGFAESGDPIAATPAANAVHIPIAAPEAPSFAVGAPQLKLTYSGWAAPDPNTYVYAQIVDLGLGVVMGPVVRPIPVVLDGGQHTVSRPLEPIAWSLRPGGVYELQIIPSTQVYGPQRSTGQISVAQAELSIPLVTPGPG
jgi:ABC-2 type transport system ATP-binding protein